MLLPDLPFHCALNSKIGEILDWLVASSRTCSVPVRVSNVPSLPSDGIAMTRHLARIPSIGSSVLNTILLFASTSCSPETVRTVLRN